MDFSTVHAVTVANVSIVSVLQLAAYGSDNSSSFFPGFPVIRWAQTANYGYVPNDRQKSVFMAVAIDLGDPTSPFTSIHPRDKQDVGARLALAGRAIAYGDPLVYYTGPIAYEAILRCVCVCVCVRERERGGREREREKERERGGRERGIEEWPCIHVPNSLLPVLLLKWR